MFAMPEIVKQRMIQEEYEYMSESEREEFDREYRYSFPMEEPSEEEMDEMYSQYIVDQAICDSGRGDYLDAIYKREMAGRYAFC